MADRQQEPFEFDPLFPLRDAEPDPPTAREALAQPDMRSGRVYRMRPELHFAIEVALTTGRPLLLHGEPGSGKSSVAPYVARQLAWRYHEYVVTSSSQASELLWSFDAVRRLADAQAHRRETPTLEEDWRYVEPGVLWWALNRSSALELSPREPRAAENEGRDPQRAVVLVDEIDKAHPDFPNGLLVALGSNQIQVPYLDRPVRLRTEKLAPPKVKPPRRVNVAPVLIVVTTNEERELPAAFVRRCVVFELTHPEPDELLEIARFHFERAGHPLTKTDETLGRAIAERISALRGQAGVGAHKPSTAEFLDAFRACRAHKVRVGGKREDPRWELIEQVTLAKPSGGRRA